MTAESLALQLEQDPGFRVLRRITSIPTCEAIGETFRAVVIDTETTGIGDDDEVIELAIQPLTLCKSGRVVAVHEGFQAFREPSKPIENSHIHGITEEMVRGTFISQQYVADAIGDAKVVIAHSASFDRRMFEKHWQTDLCWACTLNDINWQAAGYESGKLQFLLMKLGWFYDAHRALDDARATALLLTRESFLKELLDAARKPTFKVALHNTPFSAKDTIKARGGYQWDAMRKSWWTVVADKEAELAWAAQHCFDARVVPVPARLRYSGKVVEL